MRPSALLGDTDECAEVCAEMSAMIDELAHLTEALNTLGDVTPRSLDAIAAHGEQLSSQLVVAAFQRCGVPAEHVDARDVIITDDAFTRAEPNVDAIAEASLRSARAARARRTDSRCWAVSSARPRGT